MLALADFEVVRRRPPRSCARCASRSSPISSTATSGACRSSTGFSLMYGIIARPSPARAAARPRAASPARASSSPAATRPGTSAPLVATPARLGPNSEFLFVEGNSSDDTEAVIRA